jgi:hypothetical protein
LTKALLFRSLLCELTLERAADLLLRVERACGGRRSFLLAQLTFERSPCGTGDAFGSDDASQIEDEILERHTRIVGRQRRLEGGQSGIELGAQSVDLALGVGGEVTPERRG